MRTGSPVESTIWLPDVCRYPGGRSERRRAVVPARVGAEHDGASAIEADAMLSLATEVLSPCCVVEPQLTAHGGVGVCVAAIIRPVRSLAFSVTNPPLPTPIGAVYSPRMAFPGTAAAARSDVSGNALCA